MSTATLEEPAVAADHAAEPGEEHSTDAGGGHGDGGGHHGHGGHGGHGDGHGAGGHGGGWLITYCDMITLLMALFICLITFGTHGSQKYPRMKDSILYGTANTGTAGPGPKGIDQDSILWRDCMITATYHEVGSTTPPNYSDPVQELTAKVLRRLEAPPERPVAEGQVVALPAGLLFEGEGKLSSTGKQVLRFMGRNLRRLPYDVHVQVEAAAAVPQALAACRYLIDEQGLAPARLAVGVLPGRARAATVYFSLLKRP